MVERPYAFTKQQMVVLYLWFLSRITRVLKNLCRLLERLLYPSFQVLWNMKIA